jgi:hypothetical protein
VSFAIFNNAAYADIVIAADAVIASRADGTVTTRQVAARLAVSDSVVRPVMQRLLAAALLADMPASGARNGPRPFYRRNDETWTILVALLESLGLDRKANSAPAHTPDRSADR